MLEARNLAKHYSGVPAVEDISFTIAPGEILGYLGPNGSGKSTTVKMITGLLQPSHGQILLDGVALDSDPIAYKARLGYVPEEPQLYSFLSGREYLQLAGRLRALPQITLNRRIDSLLDLFGLTAARYSALASYSKGMRQKILLAAALLHNPDLIILDEPFSGLDVTTAQVLKALLKDLAQAGKIILYSSHVLEVVERVATRVIILHRGRIVADGSVDDLRSMMTLPSLEQIFTQLVHQDDSGHTASAILNTITDGRV
ncbi:ABC transporter ATP-binding protein [uncultured Paludibaculum sp.]|uniref:ABC transporter ATP-binding protein n=1 Tax=uncultured Paludibaculum sp. TaxID=1765020 RepID=UPI002AAB596F|nr:ABC transporter ATP-binding protein [uncultured Paludibaculum sp.]